MSARTTRRVPTLFSWVTVEASVDSDGVFDLEERRLLQIDVEGYQALLGEHGAKRVHALVALAMHSTRHPETGQRAVWGSREDLGVLLGGPDGGWAAKAVAPLLRGLERAGFLSYVPAVPLGRGRGSLPPAWVLHDGLFAVPDPGPAVVVETLQNGAGGQSVRPSRSRSVQDRPDRDSPSRSGTLHPQDAPTPGVRAGHTTLPDRDAPARDPQHEMTDDTPIITMPTRAGRARTHPAGRRRTGGDPVTSLADAGLRVRLIRGLAELGFDDAARIAADHDPALLAAWLNHIAERSAAGRPLGGGYLRTQLADPTGPQTPPGYRPGMSVDYQPGTDQLLLRAPTPAPAGPSTITLMSALDAAADTLGEAQIAPLRAAIAATAAASAGPGADPATRSAAWRTAALTHLAAAGLLDVQDSTG